jgi:hypothetical protein
VSPTRWRTGPPRRLVVVGAERERVHRRAPPALALAREVRWHEVAVVRRRRARARQAPATRAVVVVAVGEEDDASDVSLASLEHLGRLVETGPDVGRRRRAGRGGGEGLHGERGGGLASGDMRVRGRTRRRRRRRRGGRGGRGRPRRAPWRASPPRAWWAPPCSR